MPRHVLCIVGLALLATVGSGAAALRQSQAPASPQTPPVFRGGVDYVPVDVVVTDGREQPIPDLTAADFEILDGGKAQKIADFRFVNVPITHRGAGTERKAATPPPPPADVATNAPATPNSRLFVLIVDDRHLVETVIVPVQRVMTEFIDNLSPNDQTAVLFVGRSDLSQNFTNDRTRLLKTVASVRAAFGFGIGVYGQEQVEELPYARDVAWQLRNVAEVLANSNYARRAIVFVGAFSQLDPGASLDTREFADYKIMQLFMDDVFTAAKRSDVPIYTLDPRGIPNDGNAITPRNPHIFQSQASRSPVTGALVIPSDTPKIVPAPLSVDQHRATIQDDHLAEMAINTGGRAFINRSDITGAIDEILTENGSFYELGYYPSPSIHDGKFHDIKVNVKRPGAHVRARQGYVAASAVAPPAKGLAETLGTAMGAGLNISGLSMRAFAAPLAASAKGMRTGITIEVTYPMPPESQRQIDDDLRVTVMALDPDGKVKVSSTRPWHVSAQVPAESTITFLVNDVIDLPSTGITLRIGAASRALGKTGTIQVPLDVPKPSKGSLQLSGLAIGFTGAPREPVVGAKLLDGVVPFQPTPLRTFAATDTLRVFARLFLSSKLSPTVTIRLTDAAGAVAREQAVPVVAADSDDRREAALDANLALNGLATGDYVLTLEAVTPNGDKASRAVPIAIH
jgi:VWFA-related protein